MRSTSLSPDSCVSRTLTSISVAINLHEKCRTARGSCANTNVLPACAANSLRDSDLALSVMAFIGKNLKRGRFEIFHIVVRLSTLEQSIV